MQKIKGQSFIMLNVAVLELISAYLAATIAVLGLSSCLRVSPQKIHIYIFSLLHHGYLSMHFFRYL